MPEVVVVEVQALGARCARLPFGEQLDRAASVLAVRVGKPSASDHRTCRNDHGRSERRVRRKDAGKGERHERQNQVQRQAKHHEHHALRPHEQRVAVGARCGGIACDAALRAENRQMTGRHRDRQECHDEKRQGDDRGPLLDPAVGRAREVEVDGDPVRHAGHENEAENQYEQEQGKVQELPGERYRLRQVRLAEGRHMQPVLGAPTLRRLDGLHATPCDLHQDEGHDDEHERCSDQDRDSGRARGIGGEDDADDDAAERREREGRHGIATLERDQPLIARRCARYRDGEALSVCLEPGHRGHEDARHRHDQDHEGQYQQVIHRARLPSARQRRMRYPTPREPLPRMPAAHRPPP